MRGSPWRALDPSLSRMPLLADARGAPLWPAGFVGSITHCPGWTGAVAARSTRVACSGAASGGHRSRCRADGPRSRPGCSRSSPRLASGRRWRGWAPSVPASRGTRLLFSAKEATYKAWYPLTGIVVGHDAVRVELSPSGSFTGVASADDASGREVRIAVRGRWVLGPRVLVALCVVG